MAKKQLDRPTPDKSAGSTKPAGRPAGAATKPRDQVDAPLSRCAQCESTDRAPYTNKHEVDAPGIDASGREYTHVVFRRTQCLGCGQYRVDRSFENRVTPQRK